jgi:hydrogenase maturation protease
VHGPRRERARSVAAVHVRGTGPPAAVHVVCLGNPWHGDDGFGRHVFRRLRRRDDLPPAVELFDAGIAGLDVLPHFDGCAKAVVVDAMRVGAPVGTLHRLVPSDLEPPGRELSLHELGLSSLLAALPAVSSHPPEVVVIGAQVGSVRAFTEALSAPLQNVLSAAVEMVVRECSPSA